MGDGVEGEGVAGFSGGSIEDADSSTSFGGGMSTTTTVVSSCSPRFLIAARMISRAASSASAALKASSAASWSLIAFQRPSLAMMSRPPPFGRLTREHSGSHMTAGEPRSPIARLTARPPGYDRMGPTSLPRSRIRPSLAPASCMRLASRGSSGLCSRVRRLKSTLVRAAASSEPAWFDCSIALSESAETLGVRVVSVASPLTSVRVTPPPVVDGNS